MSLFLMSAAIFHDNLSVWVMRAGAELVCKWLGVGTSSNILHSSKKKKKKKLNMFKVQWTCQNITNLLKVCLIMQQVVLFWMKYTCSGWERDGSLPDTTSMRVWTDCCRTLSFTLTSLWRSWRTSSPLWKWDYIRDQVAAPLMHITSDTFWVTLNKSTYCKI